MIQPTDQIVAAWGEHHRRSRLVWLILRDTATGELREECIQPEDLNRDLDMLLNASEAIADSMKLAARKWQREQIRKRKTADFDPPGDGTVTVGDLAGLRRAR